jgi:hypothetical protein
MVSQSMTPVGKWSRMIGGGALVLAFVGLLAPATTSAAVNVGEEVIEIEGEAPSRPWNPSMGTGGHSGSGAPNATPSGDSGGGGGGGGGVFPSGSNPVPRRPPPITTLGEGPPLQTLKDLGFECNGGVGPADILVCHICSNTASGEVCICYDCQNSSGKCTPVYDCT